MHDPWSERVSESIDGLLAEADEQALQAHLAACEECSRIALELRRVAAAAHDAPDTEPARDLWPAIATAITGTRPVAAPATVAPIGRGAHMTALHGRRRPARGIRRLSLTVPQLAAAAVVLMAVSGAAVWMVGSPTDAAPVAAGTIIQSAGGDSRSTQTVTTRSTSPEYAGDVAELERALAQNRAQLDPATVDVIERSLESIDRAIEDARSALAADPGNPYLHRQLDKTMRKKIDVLRLASGAQRAQS